MKMGIHRHGHVRLSAGIILTLLLMLALPLTVVKAESITVESARVKVRSGAGNYYRVLYLVPRGTVLEVLEKAGKWYRVKLPNGATGFVSRRAVESRSKKAGEMRYDRTDTGVGKVASSEIMAATKGVTDLGLFAKRYAKKRGIDTRIFEELEAVPFTADEYRAFRATLPRRPRVRIRGLSRKGMEAYDRMIGRAVALRLCMVGLDNDKDLRKYVSMVGTALTDRTPLYDEDFVFIVLDSREPASFSTPGGYIFITRGALASMKNEAELAGVLSHEIIHVVQRHGIREIEKRKTRIHSDMMMDSLDEEVARHGMERGNEALMEELDDLADRMYEEIISGRYRESEEEADRFGTLVLYNTGYVPDGLKNFLVRVEGTSAGKGRSYSRYPAEERAVNIDRTIKKYRLRTRGKKVFRERFDERTKGR